MPTTLKITYRYKPTAYKQTFKRRMIREYREILNWAALVMIRHQGQSYDTIGSFTVEMGDEWNWMVAEVHFRDPFWTDARIIDLQQYLLHHNKKVYSTLLIPAPATGTITPCDSHPSTVPINPPAATCPTS